MQTIEILNEKGNVKSEIRAAIRQQAIEYITSCTDFLAGPNGLYLQIAEAQDGSPVYATLDLSISMANPTISKPKKIVEKQSLNVPQLFNK